MLKHILHFNIRSFSAIATVLAGCYHWHKFLRKRLYKIKILPPLEVVSTIKTLETEGYIK